MRLVLCILTTAGLLQAVPLARDSGDSKSGRPSRQVRSDCKPSPFFVYGQTYEHMFRTLIRNTIVGSTDDVTGMTVTGKVLITPISKCEMLMQVRESRMFAFETNEDVMAPESAQFAQELERYDVVFTVDDGKITSLNVNPMDTEQMVNVKRGLLSSFQVSFNDVETDVHGKCGVTFQSDDSTIVKIKDLSQCTDRIQNEMGIQSTSFTHQRQMPFQPLQSTSTCEYEKVMTKLSKIVCDETHIFRPFSAGHKKTAGAITTIKQSITLLTTSKASVQKPSDYDSFVQTTLIFNHKRETIAPANTIIDKLDVILTRLVQNKDDVTVKQHSAREFMQLVHFMRRMDEKRMRAVWKKYFECEATFCDENSDVILHYRNYILDAITFCGTSACTETVHDAILTGHIAGERMNMLLQGMSLVRKPTKMIISHVLDIAEQNYSRQAMLALGTLVRHYCSQNKDDCAYDPTNPVTKAEQFLTQQLGKDCSGVGQDYQLIERMIIALKAIKNAGRPRSIHPVLIKCSINNEFSNISISAMDALATLPCNHKLESQLHAFLEDFNNDPELRIHAFRTLSRCPDEKTMKILLKRLNDERNSQVASFMESHLKSLKESSNPAYKEHSIILNKLTKLKPMKTLNLSPVDHSKAYEGSIHLDSIDSGIYAEADSIFHSDSYIPRSMRVKFAATVLDVPVELLEMYARFEGADTLLKNIFGPEGVYPDNFILKMLNKEITKEDFEKYEQENPEDEPEVHARSRRALKPKDYEDNLTKMYKKIKKQPETPSGHLSFRLFGQEIRLLSYDDLFWMIDQVENVNIIDLLMKIARGGQTTITKSVIFLDVTHTVPTGAGFPLKLRLEGSAVVSVGLNGKLDIRNMFWGPKALDIHGSINPSSVVDLTAKMGVDGHFVDTGMFVNSSIFMNHMVKGKIVYKEGQTLQINMDAPQQPTTIFNVSSTPFLYKNEKYLPVMGKHRFDFDRTFSAMMPFGLGLQTTTGFPLAFREYEAPYFPLTGPAYFGINLVAVDPKLTSFQLLTEMQKTGSSRIGDIIFSTPGATYERRIAGRIEMTSKKNIMRTVLSTDSSLGKADLTMEYDTFTRSMSTAFNTNIALPGSTDKTVNFQSKMSFFNKTNSEGRLYGLTVSATALDKLTMAQTWQVLCKQSAYSFDSITNFWNDKNIKSTFEWNLEKSVTARITAYPWDQSIEVQGKLKTKTVNGRTEQGLDVSATHVQSDKRFTFYTGIVRSKEENLLVMRTSVLQRELEFEIGQVKSQKKGHMLISRLLVDQKQITQALLRYWRKEGYEFNIGIDVAGLAYGIKTMYKRNSYCLVLYGQKNNRATGYIDTCLSIEKKDKTLRVEIISNTTIRGKELKGTWSINRDGNQVDLVNSLKYGNKNILSFSHLIVLNGLMNSEFRGRYSIGQYSAGWSLYALERNVNFEVQVMDRPVRFSISVTKGKWYETILTSQIDIGNTTSLTLSKTSVWFGFRKDERHVGVATTIFLGKDIVNEYELAYHLESGKHSFVHAMQVLKGKFVVFGWNDVISLSIPNSKLYGRYQITVWNRSYEYGWHFVYKDRSTRSKTAFTCIIGLTYAPNRVFEVHVTGANSNAVISLETNVHYMPKKVVTHYIQYWKKDQNFEVSIELVPKVFFKYNMLIDLENKYKVTHDWRIKSPSKDYLMRWAVSFFDTDNIYKLASKISALGKDIHGTIELDPNRMSFMSSINIFHSASLTLTLRKMSENTWTLQLQNTTSQIVEIFVHLHDARKENYIAMFITGQRIFKLYYNQGKNDALFFGLNVFGKSIMSGYSSARGNVRTSTLSFFDKKWLTSRYTMSTPSHSIQISSEDGFSIDFGFMYDDKEQSYKFETSIKKNKFGVIVYDPRHAVGMHWVFNDVTLGWKITYDIPKKSMLLQVDIMPYGSVQFVGKIMNERVLKIFVERQVDKKIIRDATLTYTLGKDFSTVRFDWNKRIVKDITEMTERMVNDIGKNLKRAMKGVSVFGEKFATKYLETSIEKVLGWIKKGEVHLDQFDFTTIPTEVAKAIRILLRNTTLASEKVFDTTDKILRTIKDKTPVIRDAIKKILRTTNDIFSRSKPVAKRFIQLMKDFRIRGKSLKTISTEVTEYIKTNLPSYYHKTVLVIQAVYKNGTDYILALPVPYTDKIVQHFVNQLTGKLADLTENYDLKKMSLKMYEMVMKLELAGKTVETHIEELKSELKKVPATLKKSLKSVCTYFNTARKLIVRLEKQIKKELKPLMDYIKLVQSSLDKHFTPVIKETQDKITSYLLKELKPLQAYIQFMKSLYEAFAMHGNGFVRDINNQVINLGIAKKIKPTVDAHYTTVTNHYNKLAEIFQRNKQIWSQFVEDVRSLNDDACIDEVFSLFKTAWLLSMEYPDSLNIKDAFEEMRQTLIGRFTEGYEHVLKTPAIDIMLAMVDKTAEITENMVDEMIKINNDLSSLRITEPAMRAFKRIDLPNRLESYGINQAFRDAVQSMKDVEIHERISEAKEQMTTKTVELYNDLIDKLTILVQRVPRFFRYLMTVPKKEFQTFLNEAVEVRKNVADVLMDILRVSYKVGFDQERLMKVYNTVTKTILPQTEKLMKKIMDKSNKVYVDIKPATMQVTKYYKGKLSNGFNEVRQFTSECYEELINKLSTMVESHRGKTWETILEDVWENIESDFMKPIRTFVKTASDVAGDAVEKSRVLLTDMMTTLNDVFRDKVQPELIRLWKLILKDIKRQGKKMYTDTKEKYTKLMETLTTFYKTHEDKTLCEASDLVRQSFVTQWEKYIGKVKDEINSIEDVFKNAIVPEVRKEVISILEQLLVINADLMQTVYDNYGSYITDLVASLKKVTKENHQIFKTYVGATIKNIKEWLLIQDEKATETLEDMLQWLRKTWRNVENHPSYVEYMAKEEVKTALKKLAEIIDDILERYDAVKNHPEFANGLRDLRDYILDPKIEKVITFIRKVHSEVRFVGKKVLKDLKGFVGFSVDILDLHEYVRVTEMEVKRFVANPKQFFWSRFDVLKRVGTWAIEAIQNFPYGEIPRMTEHMFKWMVRFYSSKPTSEFVHGMYETIKEAIMEIPSEFMKYWKTWSEQVKEWYKDSIFQEIINHEIWPEITGEFVNIPIIADLKDFYEFIHEELSWKSIEEFTKSLWKKMAGRACNIKLEGIVDKLMETYQEVNKFVVQTLVPEFKELMVEARNISGVIMKGFENMIKEIKNIWEKNYPEMMQRYVDASKYIRKTTIRVRRDITTWVERMRKQVMESTVADRVREVLKMTVGETEQYVINMIKENYKTVEEFVVKSLWKGIFKPIWRVTRDMFATVTSEIYETGKFLLTYWNVNENVINAYSEFRKILHSLPSELPNCGSKCFGYDISQLLRNVEYRSLEAVHKAAILIDEFVRNIDNMIPYLKWGKSFVQMQIPHPFEVMPSFKYYYNTIYGTLETLITSDPKVLMENFKTELGKLRGSIMKRTQFIRDDLYLVYTKNKAVFDYLWNNIQGYWIEVSKFVKEQTDDVYGTVRSLQTQTIAMYKKAVKKFQTWINKGELRDIYVVLETISETLKDLWKQGKTLAEQKYRQYYRQIMNKYLQMKQKANRFYKQVMASVKDIRRGKPISQVVMPYYKKMMSLVKTYMNWMKKEIQSTYRDVKQAIDPALRQLLADYYDQHKTLFDKYLSLMKFWTRLGMYITERMARSLMKLVDAEYLIPVSGQQWAAVAAMFGNGRIVTFDGRYFTLPLKMKPQCSYVLAAESEDFAVMAEKDTYVIKTEEMTVIISRNGKVKTFVVKPNTGFKRQHAVKHGLPIQVPSGSCVRSGRTVECHFVKKQFRVVVDLDYFSIIVATSHWTYGDVQGLFGTNNDETYDDALTVPGYITNSFAQLTNSYELTKRKQCRARIQRNGKPCGRRPSQRCEEIFRRNSILNHVFGMVDPEPFYKACQQETADCSNKEEETTRHCSVAAAYMMAVSHLGAYPYVVPECVRYQKRPLSTQFDVKTERLVDIVVMISEKSSVKRYRREIGKLLNKNGAQLKKKRYNVRYALIGFGGEGVYEPAHTVSMNGKVFSSLADVVVKVKNMEYTGTEDTTNCMTDAITLAGTLHFRPTATRVIIVFNADAHVQHPRGASLREAINSLQWESDATMFLFDDLNFKQVSPRRVVIGQTEKQMFLAGKGKTTIKNTADFPATPLKEMIRGTRGGIFTIKLDKYLQPIIPKFNRAMDYAISAQAKSVRTCAVVHSICDRGLLCMANPARTRCLRKP